MGDGGPAVLAQLHIPTGITADTAGGLVVADVGNHVRDIDFGVITTVAGSGAADVRPTPGSRGSSCCAGVGE